MAERPVPPIPPVSQALVDYLAYCFPNRCPEASDPFPTVWMAAGSARVVSKLRQLLEDQTEGALTGN